MITVCIKETLASLLSLSEGPDQWDGMAACPDAGKRVHEEHHGHAMGGRPYPSSAAGALHDGAGASAPAGAGSGSSMQGLPIPAALRVMTSL